MTTSADAERAAELAALREAVRDLAAGSGGVAAARRRLDAEPGFDESAWRLLGVEMGLAGLGLPEDLGGAGGGLAELCVVGEELGRSLLPVPFLSSTVLGGQILARCPERPGGLLAELAAGSALVAFAGVDADGCWRADGTPSGPTKTGTSTEPRSSCSTARRQPTCSSRPPARRAATSTWRRPPPTVWCAARSRRSTRRAARRRSSSRRRRRRGSRPTAAGPTLVAAALDVALVVLAAEQVGGAAACLDMAIDYAKVRTQFSRPIGGFQSIKHKLADLLVLVEMGRSAIDRALAVADDPARLAEAAALAKAWCGDAFVTAATENVHINGGTGFTWEHDAHLYFRRSRADQALLGDPVVHRERLAELLAW